MLSIRVRARVPLVRAYLIAVRDIKEFPPLTWVRPTGVGVVLTLDLPTDRMTLEAIDHNRASSTHPLGMAIRQPGIELDLPNISEEDLARLAKRHPSEARFVRTT